MVTIFTLLQYFDFLIVYFFNYQAHYSTLGYRLKLFEILIFEKHQRMSTYRFKAAHGKQISHHGTETRCEARLSNET